MSAPVPDPALTPVPPHIRANPTPIGMVGDKPMKWDQVRADQLGEGDRVLWRETRVVESVAGNADRIEVTCDDGERVTFARSALVWKAEA